VLAGKLFGVPVGGTHAHSWVMSFPSEREAFETWVRVMPNNSVLLVDTYQTVDGVQHAIDVARKLRAEGRELQGIRLDSGDLAYLSIQARKMPISAAVRAEPIGGILNPSFELATFLISRLASTASHQTRRILTSGYGRIWDK
jgi:hypothetical protein